MPPTAALHTAIPGIAWPALPGGDAALALSLQYQLGRSQWLSAEELERCQFRQLAEVLRHARATVPFYRERFARAGLDAAGGVTREAFLRLPRLTRHDLQAAGEALHSTRVPPDHGGIGEGRTSGSTGVPVRFRVTGASRLFWKALVLRDHLWHRRDFGLKLAAIRRVAESATAANWGAATNGVVATGASVTLRIDTPLRLQAGWLARENPGYLLSYPSNLGELARYCIGAGIRVPNLREVRAMAEAVHPELRELCQEAWGAGLTDVYSSEEAGYIAIQCPEAEGYHVQSENLLVEILNEEGGPCAPGQIGRVVVTTLHNFAMPLIRYDLGDYAEAGAACACGRGLPVLRRIVGRGRNMLVTPAGERYWPVFGTRSFLDVAPVRQYQFVQKDRHTIEGRLVVEGGLTAEQEARLRALVLSRLPYPFELRLICCDEIPRGAGGKLEDFLTEVGDA